MIQMDTVHQLQELLRKALLGDKEALGDLLERHREYLRLLAQRGLRRVTEARLGASDVVQRTCLSVVRNFGQFNGKEIAEFIVWLRRIHERNVHDAVREHVDAARRAVEKEQPMQPEIVSTPEPTPSSRAMANEQAVLLAIAMKSLLEDQREAIRLRHLEGFSLAEIANQMGRSETSVAGLLKRGMQALRVKFNK